MVGPVWSLSGQAGAPGLTDKLLARHELREPSIFGGIWDTLLNGHTEMLRSPGAIAIRLVSRLLY